MNTGSGTWLVLNKCQLLQLTRKHLWGTCGILGTVLIALYILAHFPHGLTDAQIRELPSQLQEFIMKGDLLCHMIEQKL